MFEFEFEVGDRSVFGSLVVIPTVQGFGLGVGFWYNRGELSDQDHTLSFSLLWITLHLRVI